MRNRRATQLPKQGSEHGLAPLIAPVPITPPRAYLYEPDPAILGRD
ncbi:MAG: hypothetical protein IPL28_26780 [Chloroflexi bacterium]|nr:hypothetical protein [Chloroflexota bacterium]